MDADTTEDNEMKMRVVLLLVGIAAVSFAGDLVTKSGMVFRNYVLMGADAKGIKIFYNNGGEDRQAVLPVSEFPDDMKDTVNRIAKKIPDARKAAQEKTKQDRLDKATSTKQAKETAARQKKSATILQKEQDNYKKVQEKIQKKSSKSEKNPFKK